MNKTLLLQDEAVQTLADLGLTVLQAKVYIALARLSTAPGRAIAKVAKVAPQDVYRILTELHEKGLVEKIISNPNKYRGIPLEEGVTILLQRRDRQTQELQESVFRILERIDVQNNGEELIGSFVLVPGKEAFRNRIIKTWNSAKTSIDLMNDFQEAIAIHENILDFKAGAVHNDVKIRAILSQPQNYSAHKEGFFGFRGKSPFDVRHTDCPITPAKLMIIDNKEVIISINTKLRTLDQPHLWSNNPALVQIIQQWYDTMWEKGRVTVTEQLRRKVNV